MERRSRDVGGRGSREEKLKGKLASALGVMNEYMSQSPPFMVRKDSFNFCLFESVS